MVSAFNHRPSRAALRKLLAQLLLSGLFVSAVFAGVPRSQGIQPSPTIRAESNAATHTLAVNIPVLEENNIPNTTVSPGSCLFALLALAMLGVSQPSARFLANGSKDSRSLRISPIICILDSILLIDLFASLLWLGKGVREAAQCVAAFRYCEQDTDHLQLPQSSPKPTSNGTDPPIRIWSIVHEAESNTWLRLLLAIPALWQFIKLCRMGGVPVETAIGAAYVQSWLLNEISIWMGSPSTVSAKHPEKPIVTPQISYPASVLETVTMLQTTPSTTQLVLLRLVQATQACSMPCWCLILWYRMSAPHAIFHVVKAWAQDVCLVISGTKLTCTMFTYCWWVIPVAFVGMVIEVVEPGHRLVTLRKYYIPGPAALIYFIVAISLGLPFVAGVFFSVLPVSTGVYIPMGLLFLCNDLGSESLRMHCQIFISRWYRALLIPKYILLIEFITYLLMGLTFVWPLIIERFCFVHIGLFYLYYFIPSSVLYLRIKLEPLSQLVWSNRIFVFHTLLNVVMYYYFFYSVGGAFRYPRTEHWFNLTRCGSGESP